jgi:hypothetical protein
MCGEALNLLVEGVDDELDVLRWYSLNCFLNNMVAVLILDAFQYVVLKLFDDAGLLVNQYMLQCLQCSVSKALCNAI